LAASPSFTTGNDGLKSLLRALVETKKGSAMASEATAPGKGWTRSGRLTLKLSREVLR